MMIIIIFVINITIIVIDIMMVMTINRSVKLTSGCPAWWSLTAMPTHYFSQVLLKNASNNSSIQLFTI